MKMLAKCIDANGSRALTHGKVYEVHDIVREKFSITNDLGITRFYFRKRFVQARDEPAAVSPTPAWDTATRGPQMATLTGKHILKYQMPVLEQFEMQLPQNALIIRMEDQGGMFWLWAVVDTRAPLETRKFRAFKTGALIPDSFDGKYVGFCKIHVQMELGLYIFEDVSR